MAIDRTNRTTTYEARQPADERRSPAWPFWIGTVLTLIVPPAIALTSGNLGIAWVTAACCLLFTLLARAEDLAELSLGPLKAKMREQVQEAAATIAELKAVAGVTAAANLSSLMSANFMDGATLESRLDSYDRIVRVLRDVGFDEVELREITSEWRKGIGLVYHRAIRNALSRRGSRLERASGERDQKDVIDAFQRLCVFERWEVPSPAGMEQFFAEHGVNDPEIGAWIRDYRYYLEKDEIQRRDLFVRQ